MPDKPSVSDRNREYWSSKGNIYEMGAWAQAIADLTGGVRSYKDWIGVPGKQDGQEKSTRLLDFACGPGTISHALFDYVDVVRGIDIADGMISRYNQRAREADIPEDRMLAVRGDLFASDRSTESAIDGPEFFDFDFAMTANALHHLEDPDLAVKKLVQRLRPGGTLVVLDWLLDEPAQDGQNPQASHSHGHKHGHSHSHRHDHSHEHGEHGPSNDTEALAHHAAQDTITHHGFSKERMERMLHEAGCEEVDFIVADKTIRFPAVAGGAEKRYFLARGKRRE